MGLGTIAGSLVAFRSRPKYPMRMGMAFCLLWPISTIAFAAALPLPFVVALFVVCGAGLALFGVWWDTALAERMPPHLLSRVSAYD